MMDLGLVALVAIGLDLIFKDPVTSWHPIALMGKWIAWQERKFYKDSVVRGAWVALMAILVAFASGLAMDALIPCKLVKSVILFFGLSTKTLRLAISEVRISVETGSLERARQALSKIVTRDTTQMEADEVLRTAVESGSENLVDGVVAPIFYLFMGVAMDMPIALLSAFKMISTMDSMIGYRNNRYERYGKVAARLDDVAMFIPARLFLGIAGLTFPILGLNSKRAYEIWKRDRYKSSSINSGYSESLIAGGLETWFGGEISYFGVKKSAPIIGVTAGVLNPAQVLKLERLITLTAILTGGMLWSVMAMI